MQANTPLYASTWAQRLGQEVNLQQIVLHILAAANKKQLDNMNHDGVLMFKIVSGDDHMLQLFCTG